MAITFRKLKVVLGIAVAAPMVMLLPPAGHSQAPEERLIYMMGAVEPKGGATLDKEPFPTTPLPKGPGYVLTPLNPQGRWEVSVYQWSPGTVVFRQGERVTLEIAGVNGALHTGHIDRYVPNFFQGEAGGGHAGALYGGHAGNIPDPL